MNSPDLRVCSYNMGAKASDYQLLNTYLHERQIEIGKETEVAQNYYVDKTRLQRIKDCDASYKKIEGVVAERLIPSAEVFCLQEVSTLSRPILQKFAQERFRVIKHENQEQGAPFDTAIALDTRRFKDIQDLSFAFNGGGDVACAKATDRATDRDFLFVSCHISGFDLHEVGDLQKSMEKVTEQDKIDHTQGLIDGQVREGDATCEAIVNQLQEIGKGCTVVIGSDVNAYPEIWQKRFSIFTDKGFSVHRTNQPTNVFAAMLGPCGKETPVIASESRLRELDFFFTKQIKNKLPRRSALQIIKLLLTTIFCKTVSPTNLEIAPPFLKHAVSFNPDLNVSDHVPIYTTIRQIHKQNSSLISLFLRATFRRLKGLFSK